MKHKITAIILCFVSLTFWFSGVVHASPIRISINYELDLAFGNSDPSNAILGEAYLHTSALTGSGTEDISVDVFDLQFSVRSGTSNSRGQDLTLQSATSNVFARYQDGVFSHLHNGSSVAAVISPSSSFNKELVVLGINGNGDHTLLDKIEFCSSCNTPYVSVGDVIITPLAPVPLPGGLILFASGLVLLVQRRRKKYE